SLRCRNATETGFVIRKDWSSGVERVRHAIGVTHVAVTHDRQADHTIMPVPVAFEDLLSLGVVPGLGSRPFPDIPDQLLNAVLTVAFERGRVDGYQAAGLVVAYDGVELARFGRGVAPGVPGAVRPPGDPLPLGFGG